MQLIKFSAAWCANCPALTKNLEAADTSGFEVVSYDVDEHPEVASKYALRGIPALVVVSQDGSKELGRKVGQLSAPQIEQWLSTFK